MQVWFSLFFRRTLPFPTTAHPCSLLPPQLERICSSCAVRAFHRTHTHTHTHTHQFRISTKRRCQLHTQCTRISIECCRTEPYALFNGAMHTLAGTRAHARFKLCRSLTAAHFAEHNILYLHHAACTVALVRVLQRTPEYSPPTVDWIIDLSVSIG